MSYPQTSLSHKFKIWGQWLAALLPTLIVLFFGLFVFREAIDATIHSTLHPELVYAVFIVFFVGFFLACITLYRYTHESNLLETWRGAQSGQRMELLNRASGSTYLMPIYQILAGQRSIIPDARQAVLEQEIRAVNERLADRLSLPQYLAGALIGLGLVGTFIGLLGTLKDLADLFGTLIQDGSSSVSPTEMFAEMVRRLQDPMRGMGTAFVASLYGLLGSLLLGLMILAVGRTGHYLSTQMHAVVRETDVAPATYVGNSHPMVTLKPASSLEELTQYMLQLQERNIEEVRLLRREIFGLVESNKSLTLAVGESIKAEDRYRQAVPRTSYWQDAWVKVQAYLQRSNTDETLNQLGHVSRMQNQALIDISSALGRIDQRLGTHLQNQFTPPASKI